MSAFHRPFAFLLAVSALAGSGTSEPALTLPNEFGLPGVFETHSSQGIKAGGMIFGASSRINNGLEMVKDGSVQSTGAEVPLDDALVAAFRSYLSAGLGSGLDLSLSLPFYYEYLPGERLVSEAWALGDLSAILKARLPLGIPFASISLFATGSMPTSSRDEALLPKRLAYHPASGILPDPVSRTNGQEKYRAGAGAGVTFDLSEAMDGPKVALHMNLSADRTLAEENLSPLGVLSSSVALEAYLMKNLRLESEFRHQRLASDASTLGSPLGRTTTVGLGAGWLFGNGLSLRLGGIGAPEAWNKPIPLTVVRDGEEMTLAYRFQPAFSGYLQLSWQGFPLGRDGDHDGVPDGRDHCPAAPEDKDGFQDEDGCPDPDNEGDGTPDSIDNCPYTPEDHDGFEDRDGCPELDNDHDGSLDSADRCPNDPEDRDGYQDEDGCPDLDDDKDAIPDAVDKCPQEAENRNGVEDEDGCPERDADGDRIPDSRDKCPHEDEIVNFYQDEDGCPDEKPEPIHDAVLTGVEFQAGSAELLPGSFLILDGLAARMFAYPGTEIEIQGHVDDRSGAGSETLTKARAQAVAEFLVNRGIEARRMKTIGYGASRPLGPNRTAQGRALNRRIQIRRIN
jgi:outer membrane protein OmpA-like peptidoglycan-associated protein